MLSILGEMSITSILMHILAAVVPALVLMYYVYRKDRVEKEPGDLLFKLFLFGALSTIPAMVLEIASQYLEVNILTQVSAGAATAAIVDATMVGIIEEACKFAALKKLSWKSPSFNYTFDGVVYAVFVSLGFAALENVLYIFQFGMSVALMRAVLSIPAHMAFSVYMGVYYGRAKYCEKRNNGEGKMWNLLAGYLMAVTLHAVFDGTLMVNSDLSVAIFFVFDVLMTIMVFRTLRNAARLDRPIQ